MGKKKERIYLEVYPNQNKEFVIGLASIAMTYLGTVLMCTRISKGIVFLPVMFLIVGVICSVFFGINTVYALSRIIVRRPSAVLSERGLFDNSSLLSVGFVPWDEIKDIRMHRSFGRRLIRIELKKDYDIFSRCSIIRGFISKVSRKLGFGSFRISENSVDMDIEKLYALILENWKMPL